MSGKCHACPRVKPINTDTQVQHVVLDGLATHRQTHKETHWLIISTPCNGMHHSQACLDYMRLDSKLPSTSSALRSEGQHKHMTTQNSAVQVRQNISEYELTIQQNNITHKTMQYWQLLLAGLTAVQTLVFRLLRGQIWGFSPCKSDMLHRRG